MDQNNALTEDEFDQLDQFLISDQTPEACMDISMLDGFLTALLIGPNTLAPSLWLPVVWGETPDDPMTFENPDQAERILALIMRWLNVRVQDLQEGVDVYEPLIYNRELEGETIPVIDEWCVGFVRGIQIDQDAWKALLESDVEAALTFPIMLYGTETGWHRLKENPDLEAQHAQFAEMLGPCVIGIRDYWLPLRKAASTMRRESAKIGRNDPCPCGSGKKFKKCCGGAETLR